MDIQCNICGGHEFIDMNTRTAVMCKNCRSLERTRLMYLYLKKLDISPNQRVLHVAPERGIYWYLQSQTTSENYVCADYDPKRYHFVEDCQKIDLCSMEEWESNSFDLIVHSHVLEHTMCSIAYTLFHLHRILKPGGTHMFVAPIRKGKFDETFADISDEERVRRFGQADHARLFGRDDINKHLGMMIKLPEEFDASTDFDVADLEKANIPQKHWRGLHGSTVIQLRKEDYLLSGLN